MNYKAALYHFTENDLKDRIRDSLEFVDWKNKIYPDSNIYVKPNLTFPIFKEGVTTSPHFMAALLDVLKERTKHLTIFEGDGGNNSYSADEAFKNHDLHEICESRGVKLLNISKAEWKYIDVPTFGKTLQIPVCKEIVENADMTISVPVPKQHFVTRYTGAIKNHWGTCPDSMRLRNHYFLKFAIHAMIKAYKSEISVIDGEYFLDRNGPVTGDPRKLNVVMAADSPYTADTVLMDIMDVPNKQVVYIPTAHKMNLGPKSMAEIELNDDIAKFKTHQFSYKRDPVDYLATAGFHSKFITYWVYLSPLNVFAHKLIRLLRGGSRQVDEFYTGIIDADQNKP